MRICYIGNFEAPFSTENYIYKALVANGHNVMKLLERPWEWHAMAAKIKRAEPEMLLWTSTSDYAPPETFEDQKRVLVQCIDDGVPTVGYHLDLWFGIRRERLVGEKPFFAVDMLCTADGGHQERWREKRINHHWFPPAISATEAVRGTFREELACDVAFVGSWQGGYHRESRHRYELVEFLRRQKQWDVRFIPPEGGERWNGEKVRDLYASAKVIVGDSCMVPHLARYWSDRIPETTGRGGFLLHPTVEGLAVQHPHLLTWEAGAWGQLEGLVDAALNHEDERQRIAGLCMDETVLNHTYERRMEQLVELMKQEEML